MAVNVLPGLRVGEGEGVGRDADHGPVTRVEVEDGVGELAGYLAVEVRKQGGAVEEGAREGGEGVEVQVVDGGEEDGGYDEGGLGKDVS